MRTIKFRGKAKNFLPDKRRFVYGSLSDWGDGRLSIRWRVISSETAWKTCGVIPETVGQFTGLLDKNGREIYEGDIVRYYDDIEDELVCGHVIYHKESCSFCVAPTELCGDYVGVSAYWQFEVIGNIFDNPELLSNKQ